MIVRELVTKLGFTFDNTNLEKFERSIIGFKTKATIAFGLIGAAVNKVVNSVSDYSDRLLKNDALARFSKLTLQELTGLQNAFQKFNVNPEVVNGFVEELTTQIQHALAGEKSPFFDLVRNSRGAVRLEIDGQATDFKNAFDDIVKYIRTLAFDSQIKVIQDIFKIPIQEAIAFADEINKADKAFEKLVIDQTAAVQGIEKGVTPAKEFKQQVIQLSTEWTKFTNKLAVFAVPALTLLLQDLNTLFTYLQNFQNFGLEGTIKHIGKNAANGLNDLVTQIPGVQAIKDFIAPPEQKHPFHSIENRFGGAPGNQSITNNNRIEVTVAAGTSDQQTQDIAESVKQAMQTVLNEQSREIISNYPQVE